MACTGAAVTNPWCTPIEKRLPMPLSTELSREHALVKSACLHPQTDLCLLATDLRNSLHLSDRMIPWWSGFPSGGITEQLCN